MRNGAEDPQEDRRDELRRIIYGMSGEPPGDLVAELAAIERERAGRTGPGAPDRDPAVAPSVVAAIRPPGRRLLIVALGALVALALIMVGVAVIGPMREVLSPPRGLDVFERDRTAEERELADQVANAARLGPDDATTLRSVGRVFGYKFWVHRAGDEVCLLSQRPFWFEWVRTCADLEEFREEGLSRRIVGDDIGSGVRPRRIRPDDIVLVTWGPRSIEVEWEVLPAS